MNAYTINTGLFNSGAPCLAWLRASGTNSIQPMKITLHLGIWGCLLIEDGNRMIPDRQQDRQQNRTQNFSTIIICTETTRSTDHWQHGFSRNDITDVILTHLHFDHCGGSIVREKGINWSPAFKQATYWSNQRHWKWAARPNDREKLHSSKKTSFDTGKRSTPFSSKRKPKVSARLPVRQVLAIPMP